MDEQFKTLSAWQHVIDTFKNGVIPHCWAIKAPFDWHDNILKNMSRLYMCESGNNCGVCNGCLGWKNSDTNYNTHSNFNMHSETHPDIIVTGEFDKAGNIDACRSMIKELSLKPVVAKYRLGILLAADKLLPGAANSLLKIAEEPPSHVCLLFLMEGDGFLPTLKSRSRFTVLAQMHVCMLSDASASASASDTSISTSTLVMPVMPANDAQWAEWLCYFSNKDNKENHDIDAFLHSWTSYFLQNGNIELAVQVDRLKLLFLQKKLSQTMFYDLLILTLKEGVLFESIFSGFW